MEAFVPTIGGRADPEPAALKYRASETTTSTGAGRGRDTSGRPIETMGGRGPQTDYCRDRGGRDRAEHKKQEFCFGFIMQGGQCH